MHTRRHLLRLAPALLAATLATSAALAQTKAKTKAKPETSTAVSKEGALAKVHEAIPWASAAIFTSHTNARTTSLRFHIARSDPTKKQEYEDAMRDEMEYRKKTREGIKERRTTLCAMSSNDEQRQRVDDWYVSATTALGSSSAQADMELAAAAERLKLAFEDD